MVKVEVRSWPNWVSRSRHGPGYNALNEVVIEKATYT